MKKRIFDLVYIDYDLEDHYFFQGPPGATSEDFEKMCNDLLPQAGYRSVLKRSSPKVGSWVSWGDVVESLVLLLEEQGYQQVYFDSYTVECKDGIIGLYDRRPPDDRLGFSGQIILNYNYKLEKKLAEEREAKRAAAGRLKKKVIQIIK